MEEKKLTENCSRTVLVNSLDGGETEGVAGVRSSSSSSSSGLDPVNDDGERFDREVDEFDLDSESEDEWSE